MRWATVASERIRPEPSHIGHALMEEVADILLHLFPGDLDQAQIGEAEDVGAGLVPAHLPFEAFEDHLFVLFRLHVDKVDDDDAAHIPQPELAGDFSRRLQIGLEHGVREVGRADVPARVDVDADEGLGVVDDEVAAAVEPHFALQRPVDVGLDAVGVKDRRPFVVEVDPVFEVRREVVEEFEGLLVLGLAVDDKLVDVGGEDVPHQAVDEVVIFVQEGGRGHLAGALLDPLPDPEEETAVLQELLFGLSLGDCPDDQAHPFGPDLLGDGFEAVSLPFGADAPRDAGILDRGHQDQVAAGHRHVGDDREPLSCRWAPWSPGR